VLGFKAPTHFFRFESPFGAEISLGVAIAEFETGRIASPARSIAVPHESNRAILPQSGESRSVLCPRGHNRNHQHHYEGADEGAQPSPQSHVATLIS
jgi:hypothetical protein